MMGAMAAGPDAALRHAKELGLTTEQVQRLEALRTDAPAHGTMMAQMHQIHAKMTSATEGAIFDEAAARAALEEMNAMHTRMGLAMLRSRHAVRQVLTPAQLDKLAELGQGGMKGGMHGMTGGGMMGGMMRDCPMMKGGMMGGHQGMKQEG